VSLIAAEVLAKAAAASRSSRSLTGPEFDNMRRAVLTAMGNNGVSGMQSKGLCQVGGLGSGKKLQYAADEDD
jgi:hypothetical protein